MWPRTTLPATALKSGKVSKPFFSKVYQCDHSLQTLSTRHAAVDLQLCGIKILTLFPSAAFFPLLYFPFVVSFPFVAPFKLSELSLQQDCNLFAVFGRVKMICERICWNLLLARGRHPPCHWRCKGVPGNSLHLPSPLNIAHYQIPFGREPHININIRPPVATTSCSGSYQIQETRNQTPDTRYKKQIPQVVQSSPELLPPDHAAPP